MDTCVYIRGSTGQQRGPPLKTHLVALGYSGEGLKGMQIQTNEKGEEVVDADSLLWRYSVGIRCYRFILPSKVSSRRRCWLPI